MEKVHCCADSVVLYVTRPCKYLYRYLHELATRTYIGDWTTYSPNNHDFFRFQEAFI